MEIDKNLRIFSKKLKKDDWDKLSDSEMRIRLKYLETKIEQTNFRAKVIMWLGIGILLMIIVRIFYGWA
jgi:hypothetical protein